MANINIISTDKHTHYLIFIFFNNSSTNILKLHSMYIIHVLIKITYKSVLLMNVYKVYVVLYIPPPSNAQRNNEKVTLPPPFSNPLSLYGWTICIVVQKNIEVVVIIHACNYCELFLCSFFLPSYTIFFFGHFWYFY